MKIVRLLLLGFSLGAIFLMTSATEFDVDWNGKLRISGSTVIQLRLHVFSDENRVTMDSPDQGANGIEGELVHLSEDSLSFKIPNLGISYSGSLKDGKLDGIFRQGNVTLPLVFEPGSGLRNRPQTPQPPFPYATEEVMIRNEKGGSELSGTLTIPDNYSPRTPVVILVSGSGLQDRDETLFDHKPFAVLADMLARDGIASLRYDDRGFGKSTGEVANATTEDFASDTRAVMDWLRSSGRFGKVGVIGHSEGGQIAYILGAGEDGPDFIISVAGPVVKGVHTIVYQNGVQLRKSGIDAETADKFCEALEKVFEYKLDNPGVTEISEEELLQFYPQGKDSMITRQLMASLKAVVTNSSSNPWMTYFLGYDPASDVKSLKIPAFLIFGEKDTQVSPGLNEEPARRHAPKAVVKVYPELNHLMQHATTGLVEEYKEIEETMSPEVISDIVKFINDNTKSGK